MTVALIAYLALSALATFVFWSCVRIAAKADQDFEDQYEGRE
jgi:hypothetical protein